MSLLLHSFYNGPPHYLLFGVGADRLCRDFTDASILDDFGASLELSLRAQLTESALYMGKSIHDVYL